MGKIDAREFARRVFYSNEDKCWVAVAPEVVGCSAFGDTDTEALKELDIALGLHLETMKHAGLKIPKPVGSQENAGRLLLRLPKALQRSLKEDAAEEGVSVNQYALFLIATARGQRHPILA